MHTIISVYSKINIYAVNTVKTQNSPATIFTVKATIQHTLVIFVQFIGITLRAYQDTYNQWHTLKTGFID